MDITHHLKTDVCKQNLWVRVSLYVVVCIVECFHKIHDVVPCDENREFV